jgi:hypothetical protein
MPVFFRAIRNSRKKFDHKFGKRMQIYLIKINYTIENDSDCKSNGINWFL